MIPFLIKISCRWCTLKFSICRSCWRGQAYCPGNCRIAGKRKAHRKAQRRYRKTLKGIKTHRQAENRRRIRLKNKNYERDEKKLGDATSTPIFKKGNIRSSSKSFYSWFFKLNYELVTGAISQCLFCGKPGKIIPVFPRRKYGE